MKSITILFLAFLIPILLGCSNQEKTENHKENHSDNQSQDWINLLDKDHVDQWRGYKGETLPPGWTISDDMLWFDTEMELEQDYKGGSDVIYGGQKFKYFDMMVDWKIPKGGNSGIFYHVNEGKDYKAPSGVSPEYQLIDDENYADIHDLVGYNSQFGAEHPELLQDWQMTGADYAMYPVQIDDKVLHPAGEWNTSRIMVAPDRTEYWLNGKKLLNFVPGSDDWQERKNSGKWDHYPDYGKYDTGFIGFQDHGSPLWFRNIKIKALD